MPVKLVDPQKEPKNYDPPKLRGAEFLSGGDGLTSGTSFQWGKYTALIGEVNQTDRNSPTVAISFLEEGDSNSKKEVVLRPGAMVQDPAGKYFVFVKEIHLDSSGDEAPTVVFYAYGGKIDAALQPAVAKNEFLNPVREVSRLPLKASQNPTGSLTTLSFELPTQQKVSLRVYDSFNQEVSVLMANQTKAAGKQSYVYNVNSLESGVYFVRLAAESGSDTFKLVVAH